MIKQLTNRQLKMLKELYKQGKLSMVFNGYLPVILQSLQEDNWKQNKAITMPLICTRINVVSKEQERDREIEGKVTFKEDKTMKSKYNVIEKKYIPILNIYKTKIINSNLDYITANSKYKGYIKNRQSFDIWYYLEKEED